MAHERICSGREIQIDRYEEHGESMGMLVLNDKGRVVSVSMPWENLQGMIMQLARAVTVVDPDIEARVRVTYQINAFQQVRQLDVGLRIGESYDEHLLVADREAAHILRVECRGIGKPVLK